MCKQVKKEKRESEEDEDEILSKLQRDDVSISAQSANYNSAKHDSSSTAHENNMISYSLTNVSSSVH